MGKTVWVQGTAQGTSTQGTSFIPWEFLQDISCRVLLQGEGGSSRPDRLGGSSRPDRLGGSSALSVLESWTYCITPLTAKDWSCVATILKASSADRPVLVAWSDDVAISSAFVRFLEATPLTRVMMGYDGITPPLIPDAVLFSKDSSSIRGICERLPARLGHGGCALPSADAWAELLATVTRSDLSLLVTDVEDKAWTLYWYKPEDSKSLTAAEAKDRVQSLLQAVQQLLCLF